MGSIPIIRIILNIKEGEYCGRIQEYPSKKWVCIDFEEKDSPLFNMVLGYKSTLRQVSV